MDSGRANRLADRIAQIVAEMLERRVKDPRLGFVTVTDAKITGDLREATVYYTVYGSAEDQAGTAAALSSATGLIRSEVGRRTGLRHTPSLSFVPDTLPEGARHLEELVARARAADEELAAARAGAEPAGDPDPYRTERVPGGGEWPGDGDWPGGERPGGVRSGSGDWPGEEWPGGEGRPSSEPDEAYPDQVYPGDPEPGGRARGSRALGRGYPRGPGGAGRPRR